MFFTLAVVSAAEGAKGGSSSPVHMASNCTGECTQRHALRCTRTVAGRPLVPSATFHASDR